MTPRLTYEYKTINYPDSEQLNALGKDGWKVYHVRPDSGGVPYFMWLMREVVTA